MKIKSFIFMLFFSSILCLQLNGACESLPGGVVRRRPRYRTIRSECDLPTGLASSLGFKVDGGKVLPAVPLFRPVPIRSSAEGCHGGRPATAPPGLVSLLKGLPSHGTFKAVFEERRCSSLPTALDAMERKIVPIPEDDNEFDSEVSDSE